MRALLRMRLVRPQARMAVVLKDFDPSDGKKGLPSQ
jgi:hypothetical protein